MVAQKWADNCMRSHDHNMNRAIPGKLLSSYNACDGKLFAKFFKFSYFIGTFSVIFMISNMNVFYQCLCLSVLIT